MNPVIFSRLYERNCGFSLPVLIDLKCPGLPDWHFTSNKEDISFNGRLYKSAPMSYRFPTAANGVPQGGVLEIDIDVQNGEGYELLKWFDELNHRATADVVGLINERGDIAPISRITQSHGNVKWDGEKISWALGADDRLNMQVNPWVADNNFLSG